MALKQSQGAYSFGNGRRRPGRLPAAPNASRCSSTGPKRAAPGAYELHVYEVADGSVARETSVPISVVRTGFPAWISSMAENRASLYGLVAVLISVDRRIRHRLRHHAASSARNATSRTEYGWAPMRCNSVIVGSKQYVALVARNQDD